MNKTILISFIIMILTVSSVAAIKYPFPSWAATPVKECLIPMLPYADGTPHTPVWGIFMTKMDGTEICVVPRSRGNQAIKDTPVSPPPVVYPCGTPSPAVISPNCYWGYECIRGSWRCLNVRTND